MVADQIDPESIEHRSLCTEALAAPAEGCSIDLPLQRRTFARTWPCRIVRSQAEFCQVGLQDSDQIQCILMPAPSDEVDQQRTELGMIYRPR